MSSAWTIKCGGVTHTIDEWLVSLSSVRLNFFNLQTSTLEMTTLESFDSSPQWAEDSWLEMFRLDVRVFAGLVRPSSADASGSSQTRSYVVEDSWWFFANLLYSQGWTLAETVGLVDFGRCFFFRTAPGSVPKDTALEMRGVVDLVVANKGRLKRGTIDASVRPNPVQVSNITCSQAAEVMERYMPSAVGWFDYGQGDSEESVRAGLKASYPGAIDFDLESAWKNPRESDPIFHWRDASRLTALTLPATACSKIKVGQKAELKVKFVRVVAKLQIPIGVSGAVALPGERVDHYRTDIVEKVYPPSHLATNFGGITIAIDATDTTFTTLDLERLVRTAYENAQAIAWQGTFSVRHDEANFLLRPGSLVSIAGGEPGLASAGMIIQQASIEPFNGVTNITVGSPKRLGLKSLQDLMKAWQKVTPSATVQGEQDTGTADRPTDGGSSGMGGSGDGVPTGYAAQAIMVTTPIGRKQMSVLAKEIVPTTEVPKEIVLKEGGTNEPYLFYGIIPKP